MAMIDITVGSHVSIYNVLGRHEYTVTAFGGASPYAGQFPTCGTTYAIAWPTPKPPKNWRWFDVFRLLLTALFLDASRRLAIASSIRRLHTAVSMAQAARLKRRLAIQRMRQRD